MGTGEQRQNKELTTDGDLENHQQRNNINRQEKQWKKILSGDTNRNYQTTNLTETPQYF
jgi:hypothetical protein